jgi:hypothetical protein
LDCLIAFTGRAAFERTLLYHHDGYTAARVNGVSRTFNDVPGRDTGIIFPMMHLRGNALLTPGGKPLIQPAYVAISKNLGVPQDQDPGEARIVGRLWGAFAISDYFPVGADCSADGHTFTPFNQQTTGSGSSPNIGTIYLALD